MEDINNILTVGEVPNLFTPKEDYGNIKERIKKEYIKELNKPKDARVLDEDLLDFFFARIQNNFHIMFLMSKTGNNLTNYIRMFPGLVNNTTIIWFMPWPAEALLEVANKYIANVVLDGNPNEELERLAAEQKNKDEV
jgi:dynein heavy chain